LSAQISLRRNEHQPGRIGFFIALAVCLLVYALVGPATERTVTSAVPQAYYGMLTEAFLSGQTHLKLKPDPALKLLENPWAGHQGVPRLHDATYYEDRYYLYFSFVPAVLIDIPWRILTGRFLSDGGTTFICAVLGLLFGNLFLFRVWRHWFGGLPRAGLVLAALLVGLGNHLVILVQTYSVYPVPISAANACLMAALCALTWTLQEVGSRTRYLSLSFASLAWGLAVACRPNYFFSLSGLGLVVIWLAAKAVRRSGFFSRETLATIAAGILPAGIVGAALAGYNYVRFGSITEFGTTYMFAANDQRFLEMVGFGSFADNLFAYLFQPVIYSPYFPYITLVPAAGLGLVFSAPLAAIGLLWPLTLFHRAFRRDPMWVLLGTGLLIVFSTNLVSLSLLPTANERYRGDFMPAAILLGIITSAGLFRWWRERGFQWGLRVLGHGVLPVAALWTLCHGLLLIPVHHSRPLDFRPMTRVANNLTRQIETWNGVEFGEATLRIRFPRQTPGRYEPLFVSGHGQDILYVIYGEQDRIQIGFHHVGAGGPVSQQIAVRPGEEHLLTLNLGALYPPGDHPSFIGWPEPHIKLMRRKLEVSLDGQSLIKTGSEFYPTHPWDLHFGENPGRYLAPGRFTGKIESITRAGLPSPLKWNSAQTGEAVRMTVRFPAFVNFKSEPLISTGHTNAGDLLYVTYVGPGELRFGHDSWNGGSIETATVSYEPDAPQILDVEMPSFSNSPSVNGQGQFVLRYNGNSVMANARPYHATDPAEVLFGFNGSDSTAASMVFTGKIDGVERTARMVVPPEKFLQEPGPIRLVLRFPSHLPGRSEPLVTTGITGAADLIYVQYVDPTHVRFGYDHWSVGGPVSAPVPIDYAATHTVEIQMGSLYPPANDAGSTGLSAAQRETMRNAVIVRLNGETVLKHASPAYPATAGQIRVGENPVQASSCADVFMGRIFLRERMGWTTLEPK
jgi:hypothetical protein